MRDSQGLEATTRSAGALASFDASVHALLEYRTTAMALAKQAHAQDPDFCMAHCLQGYMLMMFGTVSVHAKVRAALQRAEELAGVANARERLHVEALRQWLEDDLHRASATWERLLAAYPKDILALRLHHFNSFWMGRPFALRGAPMSVLDAWDESVPHYGNLLGMLAFGLEEGGDYEEAERLGRRAVELNPHDLWALHAVAHVMEMQQRHEEGIAWLRRPLNHWADRNPFRGHLWWHLGLFLIEAGRLDEALALYDSSIQNTGSDFYLDIQNCASFLVRLEFKGIQAGTRWASLADHAVAHKDDHALVFTDLHCVMSLAHEQRHEDAGAVIASMRAHATERSGHVAEVMRRVGIGACEGILAYGQGRDDEVLQKLLPLRPVFQELGASHAQRDILEQYLVQAARRRGNDGVVAYLERGQHRAARLASRSEAARA